MRVKGLTSLSLPERFAEKKQSVFQIAIFRIWGVGRFVQASWHALLFEIAENRFGIDSILSAIDDDPVLLSDPGGIQERHQNDRKHPHHRNHPPP